MRRWVGLGVIADNIIQIGRCLALQRGLSPTAMTRGVNVERQKIKTCKQNQTVSRNESLIQSELFCAGK
jgi:hypothetical protein